MHSVGVNTNLLVEQCALLHGFFVNGLGVCLLEHVH